MTKAPIKARVYIQDPNQELEFPSPELFKVGDSISVINCLHENFVYMHQHRKHFGLAGMKVLARSRAKYVVSRALSNYWDRSGDDLLLPAAAFETGVVEKIIHNVSAMDRGREHLTTALPAATLLNIGQRVTVRNDTKFMHWADGWADCKPGTTTTFVNVYQDQVAHWVRLSKPAETIKTNAKALKALRFTACPRKWHSIGPDQSDAMKRGTEIHAQIEANYNEHEHEHEPRPLDGFGLPRALEDAQKRQGKSAVADAPAASPRIMIYCQNDEDI